ncbi:hypothetical protein NIES2100_62410 [Calothrix sp. NIES-2100]|uniref:hypothetical protein n=1 Tax=Calothrix sp. NIES-2100 TaxID=1954172 RepID=UPI000B6073D9|nr:hypothetical protein NIES2100_62410 [Calothrix sp. NIES-2100]
MAMITISDLSAADANLFTHAEPETGITISELSKTDMAQIYGGKSLPGECSIGTLAGAAAGGAAAGAWAGAAGGALGALGGAVAGAALGGFGAAFGCAVAIRLQ